MFINLTNIDFCPCNNGNSGGGGSGADVKLQSKFAKYTINGEYIIDPDEGYDGLSGVAVVVNVSGPAPNLQPISKTYTSNGNYSITPEEGYDGLSNVDVVVNVPTISEANLSSYRYRYDTGSYDVDGLKALGWDDDSIAYYVYNESHIPDQDSSYIVTDGNKALYSVVNSSNISTYASNTNFIYCPRIDTTGMTSMLSMFRECKYLKSIPVINTSSVTDMTQMFSNCYSLQIIPLLNTSSVTDMRFMFSSCRLLQTIPRLDTSKVTHMGSMFSGCYKLRYIPALDTSKVTYTGYMFDHCYSLQTIEQLDMSNVIDDVNANYADYMFEGCRCLSYIRLVGSLNANLNISYTTLLDYDSVKSILTAASKKTNTDKKTLKFNLTLVDKDGELAGLVSKCTAKSWTVSGLTLK